MDYRQRWEHKEYLSERRLTRRVFGFHAGVVLVLVAFLLNFWSLQMVDGERYRRLAENNRLRKLQIAPNRGEIADRDGEVIASTRPSLSLVLVREHASGLEDQLERLAPILEEPVSELLAALEGMRHRPLFEPLVLREDVPFAELARVESRREWFPSVEVVERARRSYPHGPSVSHAIGYVGEIGETELGALESNESYRYGDIVGKTGIERGYETHLQGERGWRYVTVNTRGRRLGPSWIETAPVAGSQLPLSIDLDLQRTLVEAFGDEAGAAVFMDPRTGEVLASASAPTFDPNAFADGISSEQWRAIVEDPRRPLLDRVIDSGYAPGSTFKVLMAIAGLETGTTNPWKKTYCGGSTRIYKYQRLCWKRGGHGAVDLRRAIASSCNVYFYHLGKEMGIDAIHKYGSMFSLGQRTGVDLPGESAGILGNDAWKRKYRGEGWWPGDTISVSIGQGLLAVTPMQMATMVAGVANGGYRVTPHFVLGEGPALEKLPIHPSTLEVVREGMVETVRLGTARSAKLKDIQVAGKTGTAQVIKASRGIDADKMEKAKRDHAWFVGYAPADDPQIAFAVIVEHGGHGGTTAAPIARKVLEVFFAPPPPPEPKPDERPLAGGTRTGGANARTTAAR